jgi:DNA polymerase-3 subunit epsilon
MKQIAFFDLETTGSDVTHDRIVSIYIKKGIQSLECIIDPEVIMNDEVIAIHGITNEAVVGKPKFSEVADTILDFIEGCILSGFKISTFDIPILINELLRCNNKRVSEIIDVEVIDVYKLYLHDCPRTLANALAHYTGEELINAHNASVDVSATIKVFDAMNINIKDALKISKTFNGNILYDLAGKFYDGELVGPIFTFGKYIGKTLYDIYRSDPEYVKWFVGNVNFPVQTRLLVAKYIRSL